MRNKGARVADAEFHSEGSKGAGVDAAAQVCIDDRGRRWRLARIAVRRLRRAISGGVDDLVVRAEDLRDDLSERVRARMRSSAPSPDPHLDRPTGDDWAEWARENLPPEDADLFQQTDDGDRRGATVESS
jgi:hypothetical protein